MGVEMVPIDRILPNRYRRGEYSEEKIEALIQSYETSGFWDGSIQARPHPDKKGYVEIAFGHHRVESARRKGIKELGLVVVGRSNDDMLRMMADENRSEFQHDALVAVDVIATVIEAYGRGEIELPRVHPETPKNAIYEVCAGGHTYTLQTIAKYLGWMRKFGDKTRATSACERAFDAYRNRASTEEAVRSIPSDVRTEAAVEVVVDAAKQARVAATKAKLPPAKVREAEKRSAKAAAEKITESGKSRSVRSDTKAIANEAVRSIAGSKVKTTPPVEVYIDRIIKKCWAIVPFDDITTECERLIPFVEDIDGELANRLADALEKGVIERGVRRLGAVVAALRSGKKQRILAQLEKENPQ